MKRSLLWLALVTLVILWGVFMFVQLYYYSYASMDSWCLFAPAAFSHTPLHLPMPLLQNFEGADTCGVVNWPGFLLLCSLFTPFVPKSPVLYVIFNLVQWLGLSVLVWAWVRVKVKKCHLLLFTFVFCLVDRFFYHISWFQRHELVATALLVCAVYSLYTFATNPEPKRWNWVLLVVSFFALPWLQPACMLTAGALLGILFVQYLITQGHRIPRHLWVAAGAMAGGVATLSFYFFSQPVVLAIFRDHARRAVEITHSQPNFFFGWNLLNTIRAVNFIGDSMVLVVGLFIAAISLWRYGRGTALAKYRLDASYETLNGLALLIAVGACQENFSSYYFIVTVPFMMALFVRAVDRMEEQHYGAVLKKPLAVVLIGLCALQTLSFFPRLYVQTKLGFPNYRAEMVALRQSLPPAHLTLIPEIMWESVLNEPQGYAMNALPFNASPERRKRYEEYIHARIQPGDILVYDRLQATTLFYPPDESGWEKIGEKKRVYKTSKENGYDITIWRKK